MSQSVRAVARQRRVGHLVGSVSTTDTPVQHDILHAETMLRLASRRISRAILYHAPQGSADFFWLHKQKSAHLASARRLIRRLRRREPITGAIERHLGLFATRVCMVTCAAQKKWHGSDKPSVAELDRLANQIDNSAVALPRRILEVNRGGKTRHVQIFDLLSYARQLGVSDLIAFLGPPPFQDFSVPMAGGRSAHIQYLCRLIRDGYSHFLIGDIDRAFSSTRPRQATDLIRLPQSVIENVLFPSVTDVLDYDFGNIPGPDALCGLPQGSACSSAAMSMVVGSILRRLAGGRWDISHYVDDIVAGARSRRALEQLRTRLEQEFTCSDGRGLRLRKLQLVDLRKGEVLDFIGYRISLKNGEPFVRPSPSAWEKARARCWEKLEAAHEADWRTNTAALFDVATSYFQAWASSQSVWENERPGWKSHTSGLVALDVFEDFCHSRNLRMPAGWDDPPVIQRPTAPH